MDPSNALRVFVITEDNNFFSRVESDLLQADSEEDIKAAHSTALDLFDCPSYCWPFNFWASEPSHRPLLPSSFGFDVILVPSLDHIVLTCAAATTSNNTVLIVDDRIKSRKTSSAMSRILGLNLTGVPVCFLVGAKEVRRINPGSKIWNVVKEHEIPHWKSLVKAMVLKNALIANEFM